METCILALVGTVLAGDDAGALRELVIEAVEKGAEPTIYVDLFGRRLRGTVKSADGDGLAADVLGQEVGLGWKELGEKGLLKLARRCASLDDRDQVLLLARFAVEKKLRAAEDLLDRLRALDPEAAKELAPKEEAPSLPKVPKIFVSKPKDKTPRKAPRKRRAAGGPFAPKVCGWEPIGLSGGGAMYVPVISPADPDVMMINCDMSGCYVSKDGGRFWKMVHYKQRRSNTRCKPALHPKEPNVILAPGGYSGGRLKITRDYGETWQDWGNAGGTLYGELLFDPDNPNLVMAGTQSGAAVSRDGGRGFSPCKGVRGQALSFHIDRTSPVNRRTIFAATQSGVWRSDDGGATWNEKTSGLLWKTLHSFSGASDPKRNIVMLYCSITSKIQDGKSTGGIYRSKDRGETWERAMGRGINLETKATGGYAAGPIAQYRHVLASGTEPMRVYAFNTSTNFWPPGHPTCFRSDDSGNNWKAMWYRDPRFPRYNVEPNYHTASTGQSYQNCPGNANICPSDANRLITVDGMKVFLTYDGGTRWLNGHCVLAPGQKAQPGCSWICNGLVVTTTWHYYVDPFQHNRHYIAYTDIGFARSLDGGRTWIWWESGKSAPWRNTCYELAFDPEIPGKAWGAFSNVHDIPNGNIIGGRHGNKGPGGICLSTDFCVSWKMSNRGLPVAPATSVVLDPKSPRGSRTLYAGVFDNGVYKSTDDGKTWTQKNNGLGHPSNMHVYRVILHKDGTLFALITAHIGGFRKEGVGLYRSKDSGENWELMTKNPVLLWPKDFAVHPENSNIVFVGAADAGGERQGGLYRTTDGGVSWKKVARYGRQHFGAYFHPKRPNWVYLTMCEGAPDAALALSTDGGNTWKPFESFPFGNTQRVTVDPDDPNVIYVTTFGGSVFRGPAAP